MQLDNKNNFYTLYLWFFFIFSKILLFLCSPVVSNFHIWRPFKINHVSGVMASGLALSVVNC